MPRQLGNLRAVILFHDEIAEPHFDLMFETAPGSALATWRCPLWPVSQPTVVEKLPDHRRSYLDYEGAVSNNRGRITRVSFESAGLCAENAPDAFVFSTPRGEFRFALQNAQWLLTHIRRVARD